MASKQQLHPTVSEKPKPQVSERDADLTYNLLNSHGSDIAQVLDLTGEKRLDRKLYFILVPLLIIINLLLFVRLYARSPAFRLISRIDRQGYASLLVHSWPVRGDWYQ